jgi:hypothetical protein
MLGNCLIRTPTKGDKTLDTGALCEALLFFSKTHVVLDQGTLTGNSHPTVRCISLGLSHRQGESTLGSLELSEAGFPFSANGGKSNGCEPQNFTRDCIQLNLPGSRLR